MFAAPLGLLALLAVPAVVGLHLYRRRFRACAVSAVFLWEPRERSAQPGRRRERLVTSASFWCEVFGALALALAVAGPRGCGAAQARHLVVVVDGSAAMAATLPRGAPIERARARLGAELARLPAGSPVTLVASGPRPRVLAGPGAAARDAERALADFEPRAPRHDPGPALSLALELAEGGQVLLLSCRRPASEIPPQVAWEAFGEPAANVGLVGARRERGPDGERVLLDVASFASAPTTRRLELRAGGALLAARELELAAGERRFLELALPVAPELEELALVAALSSDTLALDDRAYLAAEPRRLVAVAARLPREDALRLGLADAETLAGRWARSMPGSVEARDPDAAHLVVARGAAGGSAAWCLSLEPLGSERRDLLGPFLIERNHPLLAGLTLAGSVWSADPDLELPGVPIVSAGNLALLTEERSGARVLLRANLDPARSNLQLSPDWPILLANLVEARRRELPGPERVNLALGESLVYRAERPGAFELRGPGGSALGFEVREVLVVDDLERPGVYELLEGERVVARYALSFLDAASSDLGELSSGEGTSAVETAAVERASSKLASLLVAIGAALLLLDGWFLRPRARGGP